MHDENMRTYLKNQNTLLLKYALILHPLALKTLTEGEWCTRTGKLFQIDTPEYWKERLYS